MIPCGKLTKNYGKSPFFMGKHTISMAMFNSFLYVYQRVNPMMNHDKSLWKSMAHGLLQILSSANAGIKMVGKSIDCRSITGLGHRFGKPLRRVDGD